MKFINILLIVLVVFAGMNVFAQDKIVYVVTDEWADCTNADGTGLYFDILKAVLETAGYKLDIKFEPYSKSIDTVSKGKADIVIGTYKDEVADAVYPKWHFGADDISACYLKEVIKEWTGDKTLLNRKVTWLREYDYDKYIPVKMDFTDPVDKRDQGINLLLKKRIDVFLDNETDLNETIKKMKLDRKLFEIKLVKYVNLFMCFANNPKGKELAALWDVNFEKALRAGKIREIYVKWDCLFWYNFK